MPPAAPQAGQINGGAFRPDVRLVRAADGERAGLQRGIRVVWLPKELGEVVWAQGPHLLGSEFCDVLEDEGMLADAVDDPEQAVDRNATFIKAVCGTDSDWRRFLTTDFILAGCGGLGSQIAIQLAALGARNFTLIDGDHIEQSNLNRLIFAGKADCGRLKIDVLGHHLETRFDCRVRRVPHFVSESVECLDAVLKAASPFLILSADEAWSIRTFLAALYRRRAAPPFIHAGYVGSYCVAGPVSASPEDACPFCGSSAEIADAEKFVAPSALANNALIAGFAVTQILMARTSGRTVLSGQRWRFDLRTAQSSLLAISKQLKCEVCSHHAKHHRT